MVVMPRIGVVSTLKVLAYVRFPVSLLLNMYS